MITENTTDKGTRTPTIDLTTLCEHPELATIMNLLSTAGVAEICMLPPQTLEKYARITGDNRALMYADYMMEPDNYTVIAETTPKGTARTTLLRIR